VGDSSKYVNEIADKVEFVIPIVASKLSKPHMRFFLERLVAGLVPRYSECLYACQGMSNAGAQQLLLDAAALKGHLLRLPTLTTSPVPSTFVNYVNREMSKAESVLKVVLAPPEVTVSTYIALFPEGSGADFQRILDMKGLRRADAASLVLQYTRIAGPQRGLRTVGSSRALSHPATPTELAEISGAGGPEASAPDAQNSASGTFSALADAMRTSTEQVSGAATSSEVGVDSVRALFRGIESSWGSIKDTGIADRLGQTAERINESLESTAEQMKRRFGK
jgi:hypothetical protein